jgi:hypothetical protein
MCWQAAGKVISKKIVHLYYMIQTVIIPDNTTVNLSFTIPDAYVGKELEIIAFAKNEGLQSKEPKKFTSFDSIKIDTTGFTFNRDEANER